MLSGTQATPTKFNTLIDAIADRAALSPDRGITIVDFGGAQERRTFSQIYEESMRVAAAYEQMGIHTGDRLLFAMPTGFEFIQAFIGALRIGAVPIPIAPPRIDLEDSSDRAEFFVRIGERLRARVALFDSGENEAAKPPKIGTLEHVLDVPTLMKGVDTHAKPKASPSRLAFIQTTSGTTGTRRSVEITHANILSNLAAVETMIGADSDDVAVSWLPLYNVLGLLGMLGASLVYGHELVLLDPRRFVDRPETWLEAISTHKATITAAPSHAYHYCVRRAPESKLETIDLSSLRVALVGGEQVRKVHLRSFQRRFEPLGLKPNIFTPVYGLSEATLCVTVSKPSDFWVDTIERDSFEFDQRAVPTSGDRAMHERLSFVSVGEPIDGIDIMIVDRRGVEVEDGNVGEIAIRGESVMVSYFGEPQFRSPSSETRITGDWLLSGDLGYISEGRLFVVGRSVDRFDGPDGRSVYPEEIEHLVNAVDGVRPGCVVAFDAGDDQWRLVIAVETQPGSEAAAIERAISSQLFKAFRIEPDEILLLSPRSIPRSPNGKVRRHLVRMFYEQSILDRSDREDEFDGLRRMWQRARHEAQKLVVQVFRKKN